MGDALGLGASPLHGLTGLVVLTLLPVAFLTCTSFVKMSVVLSILRNALGVGQVPSSTVTAALATVLSLYVMAPVGEGMWREAEQALRILDADHALDASEADALISSAERAFAPLRAFLERHAGRREIGSFLDLARRARPASTRAAVTSGDLVVLLPSFLVTELGEAFRIGFLVYVPFLVVDLVVANVLLALGMHMLSPTTISAPFKLLLFVSVDGFYLIARALVLGYA